MKTIASILFLGIFIACNGSGVKEKVSKKFEDSIKKGVSKKFGDNHFSNSIQEYLVDNSTIEILENKKEDKTVKVKIKTVNKEILMAAEIFALTSNLNKATIADLEDAYISKGGDMSKLKPHYIESVCTFETVQKEKLSKCTKM